MDKEKADELGIAPPRLSIDCELCGKWVHLRIKIDDEVYIGSMTGETHLDGDKGLSSITISQKFVDSLNDIVESLKTR